MRQKIQIALAFAALLPVPKLLLAQTPRASREVNAVVERALRASIALKPGMTRADVEQDFVSDGGMNFRETTIYVSKSCPYLKIDVEFAVDPKVERAFAPTDKIKSVSKLYVDYPHMD